MRILHLSSDYANQKLYLELVRALAKFGIEQAVYVPVRSRAELDRYRDDNLANVQWQFSHILKPIHRFHFHEKLRVTRRDLRRHIDISSIQVVHAHFLFSDGGNAFHLFKEMNIPYIVTVRNADLNFFFRYAIHLRSFAVRVLLHATKVVFVTPAYLEAVMVYIPQRYRKEIFSKCEIIPNGVDPFWFDHQISTRLKVDDVWKLLYVGEFSKNKNLKSVIEACVLLRRQGINVTLTLVGNYGDQVGEVSAIAARYAEFMKTLPKVTDKNELLSIYRKHDIFVMPSFLETFGLVYIEALTQKMPVLYSAGQGIDGYFKDGDVGYAVSPYHVTDLVEKIERVMMNYREIISHDWDLQQFKWLHIGERYKSIYEATMR